MRTSGAVLDFSFGSRIARTMSYKYARARIGIDLDNTLISYDRVFVRKALEFGLIPEDFSGAKRDIRDYIRRSDQGDLGWQRLQAIVYGPAIRGASAAPGALEFIRTARRHGTELAIVSHKTSVANVGTQDVNLRDAAREWLLASGMVGEDAVPLNRLYFESTRAEKIQRIAALKCTHFIDDLAEVFNDPAFPRDVERILLSAETPLPAARYSTVGSFEEIANAFSSD